MIPRTKVPQNKKNHAESTKIYSIYSHISIQITNITGTFTVNFIQISDFGHSKADLSENGKVW